ncbi:MAG: rRNA maturation RNase YbeY [Alphaproteobacteria bacterium]|nr:rRNA maturation RNase YbeY [Alphaproteobacteria bacterium]
MISIDMSVQHDGWHTLPGGAEAFAEKTLSAAAEFLDASGLRLRERGISLLLADDAVMRPLNRDWRGRDKSTNVLSFPAADMPMPGEAPSLGDLVLAYETVEQEAIGQDKSVGDHTAHLLVHGLLHLLGYDHEDEAEAEEMEKLERAILKTLDIADPYKDSEERDEHDHD